MTTAYPENGENSAAVTHHQQDHHDGSVPTKVVVWEIDDVEHSTDDNGVGGEDTTWDQPKSVARCWMKSDDAVEEEEENRANHDVAARNVSSQNRTRN